MKAKTKYHHNISYCYLSLSLPTAFLPIYYKSLQTRPDFILSKIPMLLLAHKENYGTQLIPLLKIMMPNAGGAISVVHLMLKCQQVSDEAVKISGVSSVKKAMEQKQHVNCSTNPRVTAWRKSNYKPQLSQVTSWKTAARPLPFFSGSWRKVASVKIWNLPSTWCALLLVCLLHTAASGSETTSSRAPETLLQALTPNERLRAALTNCINIVLES